MNLKLCIWLLCNCSLCIAQTTTLFTYDANGNRIKKEIKGSSPHPTVTASPEAVNPSQPSVLTASGCTGGTIQWLHNGQTGNSITVTPTATTLYEARCVVSGCNSYGFAKQTVEVISCPIIPAGDFTASVSANPAKYGQSVNLYAFGCNNGTVNWSSGNIGSPTTITVYGASTIFTATCGKPYCPNMGTATVIVSGTTGCLTGDVLITKQDGSWNTPATWACGRIPTGNDVVYINHKVTLYGNANGGAVGYAKSVIRGNNGTLSVDNRSTIFVPQN